MFFFLPFNLRAYCRILQSQFFPPPVPEIVYRPRPMAQVSERKMATKDLGGQRPVFAVVSEEIRHFETATHKRRRPYVSEEIRAQIHQQDDAVQQVIEQSAAWTRLAPRSQQIKMFAQEVRSWGQRAETGESWDELEREFGANWRETWKLQQQWLPPSEAHDLIAAYRKLILAMQAQGMALESQWELCLLAFRLSPPGLRGFTQAARLADQLHHHTPEADLIRHLANH